VCSPRVNACGSAVHVSRGRRKSHHRPERSQGPACRKELRRAASRPQLLSPPPPCAAATASCSSSRSGSVPAAHSHRSRVTADQATANAPCSLTAITCGIRQGLDTLSLLQDDIPQRGFWGAVASGVGTGEAHHRADLHPCNTYPPTRVAVRHWWPVPHPNDPGLGRRACVVGRGRTHRGASHPQPTVDHHRIDHGREGGGERARGVAERGSLPTRRLVWCVVGWNDQSLA
jgi:hypothetical protein